MKNTKKWTMQQRNVCRQNAIHLSDNVALKRWVDDICDSHRVMSTSLASVHRALRIISVCWRFVNPSGASVRDAHRCIGALRLRLDSNAAYVMLRTLTWSTAYDPASDNNYKEAWCLFRLKQCFLSVLGPWVLNWSFI